MVLNPKNEAEVTGNKNKGKYPFHRHKTNNPAKEGKRKANTAKEGGKDQNVATNNG